MPTSTTVKAEYTPGQGQNYPLASTIAGPPATPIYSTVQQQVGAVGAGTVNVTFPATSAGSVATATGKISLKGFPQSIRLTGTQKGIVTVSLSLGAVESALVVGMPYIALTFGPNAQPLYATGTATATFTLQTGRTYAGPAVTFTLMAYVVTALSSALVVPVNVSAVLYGSAS
jgi:hypothetical protein